MASYCLISAAWADVWAARWLAAKAAATLSLYCFILCSWACSYWSSFSGVGSCHCGFCLANTRWEPMLEERLLIGRRARGTFTQTSFLGKGDQPEQWMREQKRVLAQLGFHKCIYQPPLYIIQSYRAPFAILALYNFALQQLWYIPRIFLCLHKLPGAIWSSSSQTAFAYCAVSGGPLAACDWVLTPPSNIFRPPPWASAKGVVFMVFASSAWAFALCYNLPPFLCLRSECLTRWRLLLASLWHMRNYG
jgi:hypothetical protein